VQKKPYDWAQAVFALAESDSDDLNELAARADLDPQSGDLSDIDLSGIDLSGQDLEGWDLSNANLENAILKGTQLKGAAIDPWELVTAQDWQLADMDDELREAASSLNPNLRRRISDLELSIRSSNCLRSVNCKLIGDLVQMTEAELLRVEYFGRKSLNEIKEVLANMGLHLGMELPNWRPRR